MIQYRKRQAPRAVWLIVSVFTLLAGPSNGQDATRTFTNKEGRKIEAELIGVEGPMAEIRRVADKAVFKIPIGTLSLEDQAWIAEWVKARSRSAPGGWRNLRVDLPNPMGLLDVVGMEATAAATRMGGSVHEVNLPDGAWISIKVYSNDVSNERLEHLVRYNGAESWKVSVEGRLLVLARDGGDPEIVGISLPDTDSESKSDAEQRIFIRGIDRERLADSVCVEVPGFFKAGTLKTLPATVAAITSTSTLDRDELARLSNLGLKAFELYLQPEAFEALQTFAPLEAMTIRGTNVARTGTGVVQPVDHDAPFHLPEVRDLTLSGRAPFTRQLGRELAKMKRLRMVEFAGAAFKTAPAPANAEARPTPIPTACEWKGIDANQELESLHILSGAQLSAAEVAKLPRLRSLRFAETTFTREDPDLRELAKLTGLLQLSISASTFPEEILTFWAGSGGMNEVRRLTTYQNFEFGSLPKLDMLALTSSARNSLASVSPDKETQFDLSQLSELKDLRFLEFSGAGQREMDALNTLPNREKVLVVRLPNGSFHDANFLEGFSRIRRLELLTHTGSFYELNIDHFPDLEYLFLSSVRDLDKIDGIARHPSLQALRLQRCDNIQSLGETLPNENLKLIYLMQCRQLNDLSAFGRTTGLKQLRIFDCDSLREPLGLDQINKLEYISIRNCENLDERSSEPD